MKQAAGKESIPPVSQPNQPNFEEDDSVFRFGYGALQHYGKEYPKWDDRLEKTLHSDWLANRDGGNWNRYMTGIRRGYEYKAPAIKH